MEFLSQFLPILLYLAGIVLLVVLIILVIKLIKVVDKVDGVVDNVDVPNQKVMLIVDLFGQETSVEVELGQIEKA